MKRVNIAPAARGTAFCFLAVILLGTGLLGRITVAETRYFPQVMDGSYSGSSYQTFFRFVNTGDRADVELEFFDDDGQPAGISLQGFPESSAKVSVTLDAGETRSLRTSGEGIFRTGFVSFDAPASVEGNASFVGIDLPFGIVMYETSVPAVLPVYEFTVMIDSSGNWDTGLAMIPVAPEGLYQDPGELLTDLALTLRDSNGEVLDTKIVSASPGEKTSRYINELFPGEVQAAEMEGSLTVTSSRLPVAAISARQRYGEDPFPSFVPTLTIYPVAPAAYGGAREGSERIMVFAPHPDDEALACAGVIHSAVRNGDSVRVVLVTCGDAYTSAKNLLVSGSVPGTEGRAFDRDGDGDFDMLDYGILRHEETLSAMDALGLDASSVVFLGYPDAGIDNLWTDSGVYTSPHTGVSEVPLSYDFALSPGKPYQRESILNDIKLLIRDFRPTVIYSPLFTDHHQDHWATGRFVGQAMLELEEIRNLKSHFGYLVHWEANESGWPHESGGWENPSGHAPFQIETILTDSFFTAEMKKAVVNRYFSQVIASGTYLLRFAKESEIFWLKEMGELR